MIASSNVSSKMPYHLPVSTNNITLSDSAMQHSLPIYLEIITE